MNKVRKIALVALSATITQFSLMAVAETGSPLDWLQLGNRLRLEYDDNIYQRATEKTDSFKIIDEVLIGMTFDLEPTFITLRYRPSFTYWSDREPDDTDLHHDLDVVLNHRFSPRASFGIKNTLRLAEQAEEMDRGVKIRSNDDYLYNVTDGNVDLQVLPRTHLLIGARYSILDYDRKVVAETENYDIWSAGVTLRQKLTATTQIFADYRREETSYDLSIRSSDSDFIGLGIEQVVGANLVATIRGGYQEKRYDADYIDDSSEPYFDATVTFIASPRTRLSLGGGYSMYEADVFPYSNQDRTIVTASVAHDFTAKLSLYLSGSFQKSEYKATEALRELAYRGASLNGGDEDVVQGSARVAYRVDSKNTLELNYQYIDLTSDLREEFDRNRISLGWRLDL